MSYCQSCQGIESIISGFCFFFRFTAKTTSVYYLYHFILLSWDPFDTFPEHKPNVVIHGYSNFDGFYLKKKYIHRRISWHDDILVFNRVCTYIWGNDQNGTMISIFNILFDKMYPVIFLVAPSTKILCRINHMSYRQG